MVKPTLKLEFVETKDQSQLTAALRSLFADTFVFYLKAHGYHWNVEGPDFGPFHTLFESISTEVYGTIDTMAEHLRKIDQYAPYTLPAFQQYRSVLDVPLANASPLPMAQDLLTANEVVLAQIAAVKVAAKDEPNLANYLDERRDAHQKHGWFLRATLK